MRKLALIPLGVVALGFALNAGPEHKPVHRYTLAQVDRGQAVSKVTVAGTVQPSISVVVGSQLSGQIKEILVDHNDLVTAGQPIARLDPEVFSTRVEQARAELDVATVAVRVAEQKVRASEATVSRSIAALKKAQAGLKHSQITIALTQKQFGRKSALAGRGTVSASDTDDARAAYEQAVADASAAEAEVASQETGVEQAKAELAVARSQVSQAEADRRRSEAILHQAETDLERTVIRTPLDGIVIDRSVTAGQTVAASFQAPTLFTIGDIETVNIEIAADEADIGGLRVGQNVRFSVDAYPDRRFTGQITQIRKSPHVKDSVVTYTVLATARNAGLLLFPGMTANADIITRDVPDALQVPNAALRYRPPIASPGLGPQVWVFDDQEIRPVPVRLGATDAGRTEILGGDLSEGQQVVIAEGPESRGSLLSRGFAAFSVMAAD